MLIVMAKVVRRIGVIIDHTMDERMLENCSSKPNCHFDQIDNVQTNHGDTYVNINGPCLIKVPSWVVKPLGRYYLYFAHHKGSYIRMAYSNYVEGPYRVYQEGVLNLSDSFFPTERTNMKYHPSGHPSQ